MKMYGTKIVNQNQTFCGHSKKSIWFVCIEMALSAEELRKRRRYVKHCFNQIRQQPFVHDVLVFDVAGVPLKSTMDRDETIRYTGLIELLIDKAKLTVRKLDSADELKMIRIKTNKFEIIVTQDEQLFFMVFQKPVTDR